MAKEQLKDLLRAKVDARKLFIEGKVVKGYCVLASAHYSFATTLGRHWKCLLWPYNTIRFLTHFRAAKMCAVHAWKEVQGGADATVGQCDVIATVLLSDIRGRFADPSTAFDAAQCWVDGELFPGREFDTEFGLLCMTLVEAFEKLPSGMREEIANKILRNDALAYVGRMEAYYKPKTEQDKVQFECIMRRRQALQSVTDRSGRQ